MRLNSEYSFHAVISNKKTRNCISENDRKNFKLFKYINGQQFDFLQFLHGYGNRFLHLLLSLKNRHCRPKRCFIIWLLTSSFSTKGTLSQSYLSARRFAFFITILFDQFYHNFIFSYSASVVPIGIHIILQRFSYCIFLMIYFLLFKSSHFPENTICTDVFRQ